MYQICFWRSLSPYSAGGDSDASADSLFSREGDTFPISLWPHPLPNINYTDWCCWCQLVVINLR